MARYEDNHFDTLIMGLMQTKDKTQQQNQLKKQRYDNTHTIICNSCRCISRSSDNRSVNNRSNCRNLFRINSNTYKNRIMDQTEFLKARVKALEEELEKVRTQKSTVESELRFCQMQLLRQ